jgi:hypothetical protein
MTISNDIAIEQQDAIWDLVLDTSHDVYWIEVWAIPQDPESIRDGTHMHGTPNMQPPEGLAHL